MMPYIDMAGKVDLARVVQVLLLTAIFSVTTVSTVIGTFLLIPVWFAVRLIAKVLRPDLGPIIGDMSSVFTVNPQDKCPGSLIHYLILDGTMTVERYRELWDQRVMEARRLSGELMFPRFRDTWTEFLGYSFWRPERKFSLKKHIREYNYKGDLALPSPCNEDDLKTVIGGIAGKLYRSDRSPWEVLLIQNYRIRDDPMRKTVVIVRHHHALIDGYGLVSMLRHLFETKYTLPKLNFPKVPLWYHVLAPLKMPYDGALMYLNAREGLDEWHVKSETPPELEASMTGAIPIEKVKLIKNKLKVSYNAVIFAAIAGAIERMAKDEKLKVPEFMGVHYPVPKENHPGGSVNHAFLVGMGWKIKSATAMQRVKAMQRAFKDLTYSTIPEMAQWITIGMHFWPRCLQKFVFTNIIANGTAVVSSFPATEEIIYFDGIKVHDLISCVGALSRMSLSVLITGMNGNQHVVLTGNKHAFRAEGFRRLGPYIEEELDKLWA